jgi:hypothetical protein
MTSVRTSITIAAPPERVWSVLTDLDAYPQWTTIISHAKADMREGGKIRFRIQIEQSPQLRFVADIVRCDPARELAWKGGAPLVPAIAWGRHWFRLAPVAEGTEFTHGEEFGGLLALMIRGKNHDRVTRTYNEFNRQLKARAES